MKKYIHQIWTLLLLQVLFFLVYSIASVSIPYLTKVLFDYDFSAGPGGLVRLGAMYLGLIAVLYGAQYLSQMFSWKADRRVSVPPQVRPRQRAVPAQLRRFQRKIRRRLPLDFDQRHRRIAAKLARTGHGHHQLLPDARRVCGRAVCVCRFPHRRRHPCRLAADRLSAEGHGEGTLPPPPARTGAARAVHHQGEGSAGRLSLRQPPHPPGLRARARGGAGPPAGGGL